ncbi:MAG: NAD(+) diphosphatase [Prevotella sp.]|nr:NAD(+) diphosphatase [Prevotella sp.]
MTERQTIKHWYLFCKTELLIERLPDGTYTIPSGEEPPITLNEWQTVHNISPLDEGDIEVKAVTMDAPPEFLQEPTSDPSLPASGELSPTSTPKVYEMCGLRASYYKLPTELYLKAGKCQEILYWDANTKFCGVCGAPMKLHTDISKRCTNCGKEVWPQLATAVIVLVHRTIAATNHANETPTEEVLLVHAHNFRTDFYGLVAGFVETGETLEEAVHREVLEETGITIDHLRYFGSQPWPYPCGLMVGFHADYVSGDIHLQREELSKGAWFRRDNLPKIPEKLSIARKLIDDWLENGK